MWRQLFSSVAPSSSSSHAKSNKTSAGGSSSAGLSLTQNTSSSSRSSESGALYSAPRGLPQVIKYIQDRRAAGEEPVPSSSSSSSSNSSKRVPSYVTDALGPGWKLRGGLGSGAYAKVFEATWVGVDLHGSSSSQSTLFGRPSLSKTSSRRDKGVQCAIKVMRDVDMESWEISRRFVRELLILRRLRAVEGVVSLYGCSTPKPGSSRHRRDLYLWFEACLTDFRQLTKMEVFLTLADARRLLRELLLAIAHMHANDIIHRDIKPANLLLHADGTLKVCDFGLARVVPPAPKPPQQPCVAPKPPPPPPPQHRPSEAPNELPRGKPVQSKLEPELYDEQPKGGVSLVPAAGEGNAVHADATLAAVSASIQAQNEPHLFPTTSTGDDCEAKKRDDPPSSNGSIWSFASLNFDASGTQSENGAQPTTLSDKSPSESNAVDINSSSISTGHNDTQVTDGQRPSKDADKVAHHDEPVTAGDDDEVNLMARPSSKKKAVAFSLDGDGADDASTADEPMSQSVCHGVSLPPRAELRRMYTEHVVTRWYRAPELVLLQPYNGAVDIWAAACVFTECFLGTCSEVCSDRRDRRPLFPGRSCYPLSPVGTSRDGWHQKNDQLQAIFSVRGTPSAEEIDALENDYRGMKAYLRRLARVDKVPLKRIFPAADERALDLLEQMLAFSPDRRISVLDALKHDYLEPVSANSNHAQRVTYPSSDDPSAGYDWSPTSSQKSANAERPSSAALGPAMSQLEDDEAWERVAQHEADADMSRVLWKLVDCFPSELAPDGGLVGDASNKAQDDDNDENVRHDKDDDPGRASTQSTGTSNNRSSSFLKRRAIGLTMFPSQWCSNFLDREHRANKRSDSHQSSATTQGRK